MIIELPDSKGVEVYQVNIGCKCLKCGRTWGFRYDNIGPLSMVCNYCLREKLEANGLMPKPDEK
jgi:hypothetical protein